MTLICRNGIYYAELKVPEDVRSSIGKTNLRRSLKTRDKNKASISHGIVIGKWKMEIEHLRGAGGDISYYRAIYKRLDNQDPSKDVFEDFLLDLATGGKDVNTLDPQEEQQAIKKYKLLTGQLKKTDEFIDAWLKSRRVEPKTLRGDKTKVTAMANEMPLLSDITKSNVRKWCLQMETEKKSIKTINSYLSACREFWNYLERQGEIASDSNTPFNSKDVLPTIRSKKELSRENTSWAVFNKDEVNILLNGAKKDTMLYDLIKIGIYTGARIEEICSVKIADIAAESFTIRDSKTPSGNREVPIHDELKKLIEDLKNSSRDGYLLSGLSEDKDGKRSGAIGKRFGRLKNQLGFERRYVFHSFRKTVVTLLEQAGISENLAADIVGHEKPRITYGLYSGGSSLEQKLKAINSINYY